MKSFVTMLMLLFCAIPMMAHEDSMLVAQKDAIVPHEDTIVPQKKKLSWIRRVVRGFSKIDTSFIEPQAYNFTVMLQNTSSFEGYTMRFDNGNGVRFSPKPSYKLGPYFGWRWIFLGYTLDLRATGGGARQAINLSLYANQVGIDVFYRKSGDNYRISKVKLYNDYITGPMHNVDFDGFNSSERGFNIYYIFNHKNFSYPAAYSQSTIQRKSCGSALAGISYSRHTINVDWDEYYRLLDEKIGEGTAAANLDTTIHRANAEYTDISLSGGYAYNWVFAKHWLFDISLQMALGYKRSHSDVTNRRQGVFRDFSFRNFNVDGVARTGLVYNNMRWYAGASAIFHTYNYRRQRFRANTTFGNVNIYVGFNFGKRK